MWEIPINFHELNLSCIDDTRYLLDYVGWMITYTYYFDFMQKVLINIRYSKVSVEIDLEQNIYFLETVYIHGE